MTKIPYITLWIQVEEEMTQEPDPNDKWDHGTSAESLVRYGVSTSIARPHSYRDKSFSKDELSRLPLHEDCREHPKLAAVCGCTKFWPKSGDIVYVVIERARTGDTFGSTDPYFNPMKIFATEAEANAWIVSDDGIRCQDRDYFGGHSGYEVYDVIVDLP